MLFLFQWDKDPNKLIHHVTALAHPPRKLYLTQQSQDTHTHKHLVSDIWHNSHRLPETVTSVTWESVCVLCWQCVSVRATNKMLSAHTHTHVSKYPLCWRHILVCYHNDTKGTCVCMIYRSIQPSNTDDDHPTLIKICILHASNLISCTSAYFVLEPPVQCHTALSGRGITFTRQRFSLIL